MSDFIITSLQSWDIEIGSTIKNTAVELAKKHRVFYISTPLALMDWIHAPHKRHDRQINENLHVIYCNTPTLPVSSLPFKWMFNMVNYFNNYMIARTIKKAIRRYNIESFIHLIDTDLYRSRYLKQLLHPAISIYYRRDYVIGFPYWRKYGPGCEEQLVRQAEIVLANSSYFAEQLRPWNPNVYVLNTGVNLELYDAAKQWDCPSDLRNIPSPIIGYTGAIIESRLNSALLLDLAKQLPDYHFVFVGPEDEHFQHHPLHQLKNVHFTGRKEVEELPQYIQHFDVCINPQILNPITDGNYPLKIDEYLAMGKPIVATNTHTMRDVFAKHTHLAVSTEEWISALKTAVSEVNDAELSQARIAFAHTHSWGHSVQIIYQAIDEYKATVNPS